VVSLGWGDLDRGLFSISVAAELAGLHPQTLRIYEREGLLDPARSAGGTRRYSRNDISRLQEICALTADGLNLAGIRRILELQEETRQLRAELAALHEQAAGNSQPGRGPSGAQLLAGHLRQADMPDAVTRRPPEKTGMTKPLREASTVNTAAAVRRAKHREEHPALAKTRSPLAGTCRKLPRRA
jgi:MerR family transcriptional regulator/heat shock protein HspR